MCRCFGGDVLSGTTVTSRWFLGCEPSTTTGRRLTISGGSKPRKSQISTIPGVGWNLSAMRHFGIPAMDNPVEKPGEMGRNCRRIIWHRPLLPLTPPPAATPPHCLTALPAPAPARRWRLRHPGTGRASGLGFDEGELPAPEQDEEAQLEALLIAEEVELDAPAGVYLALGNFRRQETIEQRDEASECGRVPPGHGLRDSLHQRRGVDPDADVSHQLRGILDLVEEGARICPHAGQHGGEALAGSQ